ncbi:MAG: hypothetical protein AAB724_01230 [Patescibacteria group bacterium]
MARLSIGECCPNCGYHNPGQKTGKCPNCDESVIVGPNTLYRIHPDDIRLFRKLDKDGGIMRAMTKGINWPSKRSSSREIEVLAAAEDGTNVTIQVQGLEIIFYDNNGRVKELSRIKPGAHYYDPDQLHVSGPAIKKAYAIAAKTMETNQRNFRRRMVIVPGSHG